MNAHFWQTDRGNIRVLLLLLGGDVEDLFDQKAGKEKVGQNNDLFRLVESSAAEAFFQTGVGNADEAGFNSQVTAAFPENAGEFANVAVGIWIAGATTHKQQDGVRARNLAFLTLRLV